MFDYFLWHYRAVNTFIVRVLVNYLVAIERLFSFCILLKTLFSPWRRVIWVKKSSRFSASEIFTRLSFNVISRGIGSLVRLFLLIFGLLIAGMILALGLLFLVLWQFSIFASLPLYLWYRYQTGNQARKILAKSQAPFDIFHSLLRLPMADFVCERLGLEKKELLSLVKTEESWLPTGKSGLRPQELETVEKLSQLFFLLARDWPCLRKFLDKKEIEVEDFWATADWYEKLKERKNTESRFWERGNLIRGPGLGWNLAYGYTPELNKYVVDLTLPQSFSHRLVGRQKEVAKIEEVLARKGENNILLVGEPGVGKQTIILSFARKIYKGEVRAELIHKRVLSLDLNRVIGKSSLTEAKSKVLDLFQEAVAAGNIILVVNEIDKFTSSIGRRVDVTDVFAQVAGSNKIQIIGVTTPENYYRCLAGNDQFLKLFEKVDVRPADEKKALEILTLELPNFEKGRRVKMTYQALKEIVKLSGRLITEVPFPEKAIDLMDQALSKYGETQAKKLITLKDIDDLVSEKMKVPIGSFVSENERRKLLSLGDDLHKRVIDQESAIEVLVSAMRRTRLQIGARNKPIGTFLFLGPTGVGKTETAKALAHYYFGSEETMIRFDMSQYQQASSFDTFLGSEEKGMGLLLESIKDNPFSVLLLDELEKADRKVLNIFLTIFDEGYLSDHRGKKVSFCDAIIIATSNAAAEFIRQEVKKGIRPQKLSEFVVEYVQQKGIFSPEFLNRFDAVIVFTPLGVKELEAIAKLQLETLRQRMVAKGVSLLVTPGLIESVAKHGYTPEFGARPLKRWIVDKIEDVIAKAFLADEIKKGDKITLEWHETKGSYFLQKLNP